MNNISILVLLKEGFQCHCSNDSTNSQTFVQQNEGSCDMPCDGNKFEKCGGVWSLSIYRIGQYIIILNIWCKMK